MAKAVVNTCLCYQLMVTSGIECTNLHIYRVAEYRISFRGAWVRVELFLFVTWLLISLSAACVEWWRCRWCLDWLKCLLSLLLLGLVTFFHTLGPSDWNNCLLIGHVLDPYFWVLIWLMDINCNALSKLFSDCCNLSLPALGSESLKLCCSCSLTFFLLNSLPLGKL